MADDGQTESYGASYNLETGFLTSTLRHMSVYIIAYEPPAEQKDNSLLYAAGGIIALFAVFAAGYVVRIRNRSA